MTAREKYFAESHLKPLGFAKWLTYFYFLGAALTPMHEYRDLEDFINYRGKISKMPLFGNFLPALRRFGETIFCLVLLTTLTAHLDIDYLLTAEFGQRNIAFKIAYLIASMHVEIWRLFTVFGAIESMFIATGYSYSPKEGKSPENYNSLRAVEMIRFETSLTAFDSIERWNMATQRWLKYYTQMRMLDRTQPRGKI